ncbi:MAG: hypothetical protein ACRDS0_24060 [Pseudonocardiaceae bacterium]
MQAFIDHLLGQAGLRTGSFRSSTWMGGSLVWCRRLTSPAALPADRRTIAVRQLARPLSGELVLSPDMPLEQVLRSTAIVGGGALAAVVVDDHVVGVLTGTDIARAVEINALRFTPESTR